MEYIVIGCKSCPMANWEYEECQHPSVFNNPLVMDKTTPTLPIHIFGKDTATSARCPLRTENLTIYLQE